MFAEQELKRNEMSLKTLRRRKLSWHFQFVQSRADFLENEAKDDISVGSVGRRLNSIVSLELLFTSKTRTLVTKYRLKPETLTFSRYTFRIRTTYIVKRKTIPTKTNPEFPPCRRTWRVRFVCSKIDFDRANASSSADSF